MPPEREMERPTRPKIAGIDVRLLEIQPVFAPIRRISGSQANLAKRCQSGREHLASLGSGQQDLEGFVPRYSSRHPTSERPTTEIGTLKAGCRSASQRRSWMLSISEIRGLRSPPNLSAITSGNSKEDRCIQATASSLAPSIQGAKCLINKR